MSKRSSKLHPEVEKRLLDILAAAIQERYSTPLCDLRERADQAEARAVAAERRLTACEALLAKAVGVREIRIIMEGRA